MPNPGPVIGVSYIDNLDLYVILAWLVAAIIVAIVASRRR